MMLPRLVHFYCANVNDFSVYSTLNSPFDCPQTVSERQVRQKWTRSGGTNKKNDAENKLLLVFPFDVDEESLSEASRGLLELGGDLLGVVEDEPSVEDQLDEDDVTRGTKKPPRTHHVTIRDEDYERLSPGQFLNDTLVDFWMRW
jgi:hypothetical protein